MPVSPRKRTVRSTLSHSCSSRLNSSTGQLVLSLAGLLAAAAAVFKVLAPQPSVSGKVVLITGGSRGLGLEIARQFGQGGARLILISRHKNELDQAREILMRDRVRADDIELIPADIIQDGEAERIIQVATSRFGQVDILVNNAGVIGVAAFQDQPIEAFYKAMDTHYFGPLHLIRSLLPQMLQRRSGAIVNISSIGGKIPVPHMLPYVGSKFALVGLSEGLHTELRSQGIRVTTVCPGLMRTGAHVQAEFGGQQSKEYRWFGLGATLPLASISARRAARQIYKAVLGGRAELIITLQAEIAARTFGLAPGISQQVAAAASEYLLPAPNGNSQLVRGGTLPQPTSAPARKWNDHLQTINNQNSST